MTICVLGGLSPRGGNRATLLRLNAKVGQVAGPNESAPPLPKQTVCFVERQACVSEDEPHEGACTQALVNRAPLVFALEKTGHANR